MEESGQQSAFRSVLDAHVVVNCVKYTHRHTLTHTQVNFKIFDLVTQMSRFGNLIQHYFLFLCMNT